MARPSQTNSAKTPKKKSNPVKRKAPTATRVASVMRVRTIAKVAGFCGVSSKTVQEWIAKGCPGKTAAGDYDLSAIVTWRIARERDDRSPLTARLQEAKVQVAEASAKIKTVEADMKVGAVVKRADVDSQNIARARVLKQSLMRIPTEAAPLLVGKSVTKIKIVLRERVARALKSYVAAGM